MLSDFLFFKNFKIGIPEKAKCDFYWDNLAIIAELRQKDPDWNKIFQYEEKQWPVLRQLDFVGLPLYTESNLKKEDVRSFINLILEEKRVRLNLSADKFVCQEELKKIIQERTKFFEMMLEINEKDIEDFRKSSKKWWLIGGAAIAILGFYGVRKLVKNDKNKDKKGKK